MTGDDRPAAYHRPWPAVLIAAAGAALTVAVLLGYPVLRAQLRALPAGLTALIDLVVLNLPLVAAVIVAGMLASNVGIARATGIRPLRGLDIPAGIGVGLVLRALVELVAPTTGSLGGPFGGVPPLLTTVVLVLGIGLISPVCEELFFRGLLLRALADALGGAGRILSAVVAIGVSTLAFTAVHFVTATGGVAVGALLAPVAVGLGCGILTVVTGRLGAAIAAHVVFNTIGVVLLLV